MSLFETRELSPLGAPVRSELGAFTMKSAGDLFYWSPSRVDAYWHADNGGELVFEIHMRDVGYAEDVMIGATLDVDGGPQGMAQDARGFLLHQRCWPRTTYVQASRLNPHAPSGFLGQQPGVLKFVDPQPVQVPVPAVPSITVHTPDAGSHSADMVACGSDSGTDYYLIARDPTPSWLQIRAEEWFNGATPAARVDATLTMFGQWDPDTEACSGMVIGGLPDDVKTHTWTPAAWAQEPEVHYRFTLDGAPYSYLHEDAFSRVNPTPITDEPTTHIGVSGYRNAGPLTLTGGGPQAGTFLLTLIGEENRDADSPGSEFDRIFLYSAERV